VCGKAHQTPRPVHLFLVIMPIYAYKCESCGHRKDVLQKMSDPLLTDCPACGAPTFVKQVTAAGFQLKGSGWYVTDFRDGGGKKDKPAEAGAEAAGKSADKAPEKTADAGGSSATGTKAAEGSTSQAATASPAPAPSPTPSP
jgi:putative FmdB family regulatory protein